MVAKGPTKKELQALIKTLEDLIFYSKAHLANTTSKPDNPGTLNIWGADLYTWGDLNTAIHRSERMLQEER